MRLAILADIHGNVLALEAVLTDLEHRRVDEVVNLRDCVSGPLWPRETAQLLMGLDWRTVRGNHDRWVTDWLPEQHYASDAFAFRELDAAQLAWLRVDGIVMPAVPLILKSDNYGEQEMVVSGARESGEGDGNTWSFALYGLSARMSMAKRRAI